jgi:hypothetical protein
MDTKSFRSLSAREKALVAVAVLLDGNDAISYLGADGTQGEKLRAAAKDLAQLELELRVPFVGTQLRLALDELV